MRSGKTHFITLDGLRGVAALIIVVYHRRWWLWPNAIRHGYLAVDFFFLLSGFVIAHAYEDRLRHGGLGFWHFTRLRAERLAPLVMLGAVAGIAVMAVDAHLHHRPGGVEWVLAALPFALLTLPVAWLEKPFLVNGPSWSLFFEIIVNLAYAGVARMLTELRLALLLAGGVAGLLALVWVNRTISVGWLWPNMAWGILRTIAPFVGGVALHRLWVADRLRVPPVPVWLLGLVLALLLLTTRPLGMRSNIVYELGCVLVLFPTMLALGARSQPAGIWKRIAMLSGELSFPVYILHYPVLQAFDLFRPDEHPAHAFRLVAVEFVASIVVAFAASRLYDIPARRWLAARRRAGGERTAHPAGGVPDGLGSGD